jgi:hypothetical protein
MGLTQDDKGATLVNVSINKRLTVLTKAGNYSPTSADDVILCTATLTISLPAAVNNVGMGLFVKNIGATGTIVTVDANASELIDNSLTITLDTMESVLITCDGNGWWII